MGSDKRRKVMKILEKGEARNENFYTVKEISQDDAFELYKRIGKFVQLRAYNIIFLREKKEQKEVIDYGTFCRWLSYQNRPVEGMNFY
jgi:hypothetical protein